MRPGVVTGAQLAAWANRKITAAEKAGRGTICPTMREACKRFSCSMDAIRDACEDGTFEGDYLGIAVAVGGNGGYYPLKAHEQLIEVEL